MASYQTKIPGLKKNRCTVYTPALAEKLYNLGVNGESKAEIARLLGTSAAQAIRWRNDHEEFRVAYDFALTNSAAFHSKQMRENALMPGYVPHVPKFFLTHEHKWNDRPEADINPGMSEEDKAALERVGDIVDSIRKKSEREF